MGMHGRVFLLLLNQLERTCVAVFHLPHEVTATALYASPPSDAANSRKADMAISLPMITASKHHLISTAHYRTAAILMQLNSKACLRELMTGRSQSLPTRGPEARGRELMRIRTAATMSLSATGSRNAPKLDMSPWEAQAYLSQLT